MKVPVSTPLLGAYERKYVTSAIKKGHISGLFGDYLPEFETAFAKFCGTKYCALVNSGTTALHLAIAALNIGKGDEVLVATFTNMATFFAVLYEGATPIPVDIEPDTFNIDVSKIEEKITPRTKAIIVVHIYGHSVDMDPVMAIAKKHNLYVIEDAAEAHGATYKGRPVGSIGHIGCFSFYSNKIITTGEGGAVTTDDKALIERIKNIKNLAFGDTDKFMHKEIGFKYQMTNLQAAVGAGQMKHVKDILKRKRAIGAYYTKHLKNVVGIQLPVEKAYAKNVYWMFNLVLAGPLSGKRAQFMDELKKRGVETREDFVPYNEQKFFIDKGLTRPSDCPTASRLYKEGFYIPSGTLISQKELAYVVKQIKEVAAAL